MKEKKFAQSKGIMINLTNDGDWSASLFLLWKDDDDVDDPSCWTVSADVGSDVRSVLCDVVIMLVVGDDDLDGDGSSNSTKNFDWSWRLFNTSSVVFTKMPLIFKNNS